MTTVRVVFGPVTALPIFGALLSGREVSATVTMLVEASEPGQHDGGGLFVQGRVSRAALW
jgi:hypothetical protein